MGKLGGKAKIAPRARQDSESSDSDSGNALAKLREERRLAREKQEAARAAEAKRAAETAEAARAADAARKQCEEMEAARALEDDLSEASNDIPASKQSVEMSDAEEASAVSTELPPGKQPLEMSDAEFLASLGLDGADLGSTEAVPVLADVEEVRAQSGEVALGVSSPRGSDTSNAGGADPSSSPTLLLAVLGEVLPMRLEREAITVAELTRYWQTSWGIQYASKLSCFKRDEDTGRERKLRNFEEIVVSSGDVLRVHAGAGAHSILSALSLALKRFGQKTSEQVEADCREQTKRREAAASSNAGSELERFKHEEKRRERLAAQIQRRFEAPAGNVHARIKLEKWNVASEKQAPRNELRLPSRANPSDIKYFILPGT